MINRSRSSEDSMRLAFEDIVSTGIIIGGFLGIVIGMYLDIMWHLSDNHNERQISPYSGHTFDAVSFSFCMGGHILGAFNGGAVGYAVKNRMRLFSQGDNSKATVNNQGFKKIDYK